VPYEFLDGLVSIFRPHGLPPIIIWDYVMSIAGREYNWSAPTSYLALCFKLLPPSFYRVNLANIDVILPSNSQEVLLSHLYTKRHARMGATSTWEVAHILEYVGLALYLPRLLDEGFDDVGTLRDMTEDDMVKLGIEANDRKTLRRVIERLWKDYKSESVTENQG
jgi:hypothetical protein